MIFYFTGTGNSLYAAAKVADALGDRVVSIAKEMDEKKDHYFYEPAENEVLGFVYPVYAWAPPKMVLDFISKMEIKGKPYVFSLATCGDEEGKTTNVLRKALAAKGLELDAAFSLVMPNNYIIGFDVDTKTHESEKLRAAEQKLTEINKIIKQRQKNEDLIIPGKLPVFKTALGNPLFNRFAMSTKKFYTDENCTGCGLCEKICPVHTITVSGKPEWGKKCTQCLGCIHRCPVHAIQYGKGTAAKGRYLHPELARLEGNK
jgi:ferredoxin